MEKNEIIMDEDPEIKSLNDQELFIYRYLNEENKSKIKSELNSKISLLEKIEESVSEAEDDKEKEINEKIQNYFNAKNKSNIELNILYTVDDLQKEKITLEKNIKEKKEAKELLKQLTKILESDDNIDSAIASNLIQKIKSNGILSKNQSLNTFISKSKLSRLNKEEENLTEEQKILSSFRNLIKITYKEAKNDEIIETTILKLFKELNFEDFDISNIIKENEENKEDDKLMDFFSLIKITSTFDIFLKELHKYNPIDNKEKTNLFYKIISLLFLLYEYYFSSINNSSENNFEFILMHNNLEYLTYLLNYYILFYCEQKDLPLEDKENINNTLINIVIKIKNLSVSMFSQVVANFINNVIEELTEIESFTDIGKEQTYNTCITKVTDSIEKIFKFFEELRVNALNREVVFYFNNVLTIYFDLLNQKILKVNSYDLNDINGILNVNQEIIKKINSNIEKISSQNMDLGVKFMNNLEKNIEYLKFQEILFILNSNLKQIKNYLISKNNTIYIRKHQFVELLESIFNKSEKLEELINIINTIVKEQNNLN
jgi:hypothetical protein